MCDKFQKPDKILRPRTKQQAFPYTNDNHVARLLQPGNMVARQGCPKVVATWCQGYLLVGIGTVATKGHACYNHVAGLLQPGYYYVHAG